MKDEYVSTEHILLGIARQKMTRHSAFSPQVVSRTMPS
jgi:Clp amino terminal domain.